MNKRQQPQAIKCFIDAINQDGAIFVDEVIAEFDKQEHLKEDALKLLFREVFTADGDIRATLVKVTCLNEFYSTGLNSNPPIESPARESRSIFSL